MNGSEVSDVCSRNRIQLSWLCLSVDQSMMFSASYMVQYGRNSDAWRSAIDTI